MMLSVLIALGLFVYTNNLLDAYPSLKRKALALLGGSSDETTPTVIEPQRLVTTNPSKDEPDPVITAVAKLSLYMDKKGLFFDGWKEANEVRMLMAQCLNDPNCRPSNEVEWHKMEGLRERWLDGLYKVMNAYHDCFGETVDLTLHKNWHRSAQPLPDHVVEAGLPKEREYRLFFDQVTFSEPKLIEMARRLETSINDARAIVFARARTQQRKEIEKV